MTSRAQWAPALVLCMGVFTTFGMQGERRPPLRAPLNLTVPDSIAGFVGQDITLTAAELAVAGPTAYLMRAYRAAPNDTAALGFSVYVGYYDHQTQGRTIHSPKNCLPGSGWEPLTSRAESIATDVGPVTVNRYLLQNKKQRALVLYWYQGRGRVAWNEYRVKWELLRDSALHHRSDEALVRVIVPIQGEDETDADRLATEAAKRLVPALYHALPS